jgi:hypothetical protein
MDGKFFGHYVPRKVIYSFFLVIVVVIIIAIVIFVSFSQVLQVSDAEVSVTGTKAGIGMNIRNVSYHPVSETRVIIKSGSFVVEETLPTLQPDENIFFYKELEIPENNVYEVSIISPNNQPIRINFEIENSTIDPVRAEVTLSKRMYLGEEYDLKVNLCNISESNLPTVQWVESFNPIFFSGEGLTRSISLDASQCKYLYSKLIPIQTGNTKIDFILRIGSSEKTYSQDLIILEAEEV